MNAIICTVRSQLRDFSSLGKHHTYWIFAGSIKIESLTPFQGRAWR